MTGSLVVVFWIGPGAAVAALLTVIKRQSRSRRATETSGQISGH